MLTPDMANLSYEGLLKVMTKIDFPQAGTYRVDMYPTQGLGDGDTVGGRLNRRRIESGLTMEELARKAGFSGQSSIQRYLAPDYDLELRPHIARKFESAFGSTDNLPNLEAAKIIDIAITCGADGTKMLKALDMAGFEVVSKKAIAVSASIDDPLEYVKEVLSRRNISATQLARQCGLAASTLNRALNKPDHKCILSGRTIRKIKEWDAAQ